MTLILEFLLGKVLETRDLVVSYFYGFDVDSLLNVSSPDFGKKNINNVACNCRSGLNYGGKIFESRTRGSSCEALLCFVMDF